jgi:hypothetical protein
MKITETWLEGVGSLNGLLRESCFSMTPCDNNYELLCFQENNVLLYSNPAYDNCFIDTLLVSVTVISKLDFQVEIYDISGKK